MVRRISKLQIILLEFIQKYIKFYHDSMTYIYIYIFVCVCVCRCIYIQGLSHTYYLIYQASYRIIIFNTTCISLLDNYIRVINHDEWLIVCLRYMWPCPRVFANNTKRYHFAENISGCVCLIRIAVSPQNQRVFRKSRAQTYWSYLNASERPFNLINKYARSPYCLKGSSFLICG